MNQNFEFFFLSQMLLEFLFVNLGNVVTIVLNAALVTDNSNRSDHRHRFRVTFTGGRPVAR